MNIRDSYIELFNLIFVILYIIHIVACVWHLIAIDKNSKYDDQQSNWLEKYELASKTKGVRYIYSLYWACVTIMTVGYGDITPQNPNEIMFTIFAVFIGCLVGAYIISSIGGIFNEFNQENQRFKSFLFFLKFLLKNNL